MKDASLVEWPFFDAAHERLQRELSGWIAEALPSRVHTGDVDEICRARVRALGEAGWLRYCVPGAYGGAREHIDSRSLCLVRRMLGRADGLADFAFAMQGLGSGPIGLFGSPELRSRYLPDVAAGRKIAAFGLTEPDAGSDAGAMATTAVRVGDTYRITGTKTFISNAGLADFYCIFARTENDTAGGISAFVVDAATRGLSVIERIDICAPHPIGVIQLDACEIPAEQRLGEPGKGFKVALSTLDVFRASVGAAALGFAEAAHALALQHTSARQMFGTRLADLQLTSAAIGEMATEIEASALLVFRAAWERDVLKRRTTRSAAMAKFFATEAAQGVIDRAVQMHGGNGVRVGHPIELLYREIRALRIYEGATEVQKLIIGKEEYREWAETSPIVQ
jgi:acyl-CoA dehydrogenase